jgi:hypothetical protein
VAFAFAAFFHHPFHSVVGDEVLIGDPDEFQVAFPVLGAQGRFRQATTEEQFASFFKGDWIIISDFGERLTHCAPPCQPERVGWPH